MPDLGKYAVEVLSAYGVTIGLIAVLIVMSFMRASRVRRALDDAETRSKPHGG